ncbi:MAG: hypothetical protein IT245_01290 [Bacteroidia bacterium]|nr:hypothetical protein [Bacteroidia bacterium]
MGEKTKQLMTEVHAVLKERGAEDVNLWLLIDAIIENRNPKIVDKFLTEMTPLEYKLKQIMNDQKAMNELNKITNQHNFGLPATS